MAPESVLAFLLEPFGYVFMQRALVVVVLMGVTCGVVGTYVVVRGMAFLGDALAHSIFPGVVVAYMLRISFLIGALVAGLITVLGVELLSRHSRVREDTAIGVSFVGAFALGVVLLSQLPTYSKDLAALLLGDILAVSIGDLVLIAGTAFVVLALVGLLFKELLLVSFDPTYAETQGLPRQRLDQLLLIIVALTVVVALLAVGNLLIVAMLVAPSGTARFWTHRVTSMMACGAGFAVVAGIVGLYVSYYLNVPSGAAMVLVATVLFIVSSVLGPQGAVSRRMLARS